MGNCSCSQDRYPQDQAGSIGANAGGSAAAGAYGSAAAGGAGAGSIYKVANHKSKITPATFASIPPSEKDSLLAEAFKILTTTVEPNNIKTNNAHIRQLTAKVNGTAKNSQGSEYTGEFINGVANGKGKIKDKNGAITEGEFFNGVPHGVCTKNSKDSKETYYAYNGVAIGSSRVTLKDGTVVDQLYQDNMLNGPVLTKNSQGNTYAFYKDNKKEGPELKFDSKNPDTLKVSEYKEGKAVFENTTFSGKPATK